MSELDDHFNSLCQAVVTACYMYGNSEGLDECIRIPQHNFKKKLI